MPRSKSKEIETFPLEIKPSTTAYLFASRRTKGRSQITHEQIAEDLDRFHETGGRIEVLGVTRVLKNIPETSTDQAQSPPRAAWPLPRRSGRTV